MSRITCLALSFFLSAVLVAQEPVTEPPGELEAIAVNVMLTAYQVADYNTVETLFDKLSIDNKKKFLQKAIAMSAAIFGRDLREGELPQTFLDLGFTVIANTSREPKPKMEDMPEMFERWAVQKSEQTQLLGRLTLSLFEQSERHSLSSTELPIFPRPYSLITQKDKGIRAHTLGVLNTTKGTSLDGNSNRPTDTGRDTRTD